MTKLKIAELKKTAKELNELLFDSEEKEKGWIDTKLSQGKLEKEIIKAEKFLHQEPIIERNDLLEVSQKVLNILCPVEAEEEEENEEQELSLEEQVEEGHIDDLKKLVKGDETFKPLRKGIGIQKDAEKLRAKMLAVLKGEQETPKPDKKEKKKKEKDVKPKAEKTTNKKEKGASYYVRYFTCENPKITVEEIEAKLNKKGLSQSKASISIRRTEMLKAFEIMKELGKLK